jgi:hypothetical protein
VTAFHALAALDAIAIGEQHRIMGLFSLHQHAVARQHIRPIREESNTAKALGLALGAQDTARGVEPHQLAVLFGLDLDQGRDFRFIGIDRDNEPIVLQPPNPAFQGLAVAFDLDQLQPLAVEAQRFGMIAVAHDLQPRADQRLCRIEPEIERDFRYEPVGRAIVFAADG